MIRCLNTLFCKELRVEDDGLMTIASIYSGFSRRDLPANIQLCFVSFLELSFDNIDEIIKQEFNARVIINAPWGLTIGDSKQKIPFRQISDSLARSTLAIQFGEVVFTEFGQYAFDVFVNDEHLCTATLDIVQEDIL